MNSKQNNFPSGWDSERVRRLTESLADEDGVEDDESEDDQDGMTVVIVPDELVPAIQKLIAEAEDNGNPVK